MKINLDRAPWHRNGDLVEYVWDSDSDKYDWRPNQPFEATLQLTGTSRGRSAARYTWESLEGAKLEMFMADMFRLVTADPRVIEPGGSVRGEWLIVKRGANYGVTPFLPGDTYPNMG